MYKESTHRLIPLERFLEQKESRDHYRKMCTAKTNSLDECNCESKGKRQIFMPNRKRNVSVEMWDILKVTLGNFSVKVRIILYKNILFGGKSKLNVLHASNSGDYTLLSVVSLDVISMCLSAALFQCSAA